MIMQFNKKTVLGLVAAIAVLAFVFHYLSSLLIYTIVAFVISMLGRPLVQWLNRRFRLPFALGAVIALAVILTFVVGVGWLVFPMFIQQGQALVMMDYGQLTSDTYTGFQQFTVWLADKGISLSETEVKGYVLAGIQQLVQMISFKDIIANTAGFLTSFAMGLFCVVFIAFFFLKDEKLFKNMLFLFIPDRYTDRAENVLHSSEKLLTRYFVGLSIEVVCMMLFLSLGLWALGIDHAALYGCIGGVLNIIPYLGPVIGAVLATVFAIINDLEVGFTVELAWVIVKVLGVFVGANLIDNFVLQPLIYANSVKSHPLEIFFVIIIAGTLTGPGGMIVAIPLYTVLRVIAREFFKGNKFVDRLTRRML